MKGAFVDRRYLLYDIVVDNYLSRATFEVCTHSKPFPFLKQAQESKLERPLNNCTKIMNILQCFFGDIATEIFPGKKESKSDYGRLSAVYPSSKLLPYPILERANPSEKSKGNKRAKQSEKTTYDERAKGKEKTKLRERAIEREKPKKAERAIFDEKTRIRERATQSKKTRRTERAKDGEKTSVGERYLKPASVGGGNI